MKDSLPCPCGGPTLARCCGPYLGGAEHPATAEALMRARYSAYVLGRIDYLSATHLPGLSAEFDPASAKTWAEESQWQSLQVLRVKAGRAEDTEGEVEFIATYRQRGQLHTHHEISRFVKEGGRWFYARGRSGPSPSSKKQNRNEPCACGSGLKYKRCCGARA